MSDNSYAIPRTPDKALIKFAQDSLKEFPFLGVTIYTHGYPNKIEIESEEIRHVSSKTGTAIRLMSFDVPGFTLFVERSKEAGNISDKVTTRWDSNTLHNNQLRHLEPELFRFVTRAHNELGRLSFSTNSFPNDANTLSVTVHALESLQLEIVQKYNDLLSNNISRLDDERSRLSQSFDREREELLSIHRRNIETIEEQRREFEILKAQFDDRNNTHARREIRKDIKTALANRVASFRLSKNTVNLRILIHIVFWIIFILSAATMWINFLHVDTYVLTSGELNFIFAAWLMLRSLLSFAVFVGAVSFYIRWQNEWFRKTSDAELLVRQTEIDIDRASWAIESALEWQISRGGNIPDVLLDGITRDLFRRDHESSEFERANPADHLASAILGSAAKVRIDSTGAALARISHRGGCIGASIQVKRIL